MAFIVPGVCRYTVHGLVDNRPTANVIDYFIDTTGSWEERADACDKMCGIVLNEVNDSWLPQIVNTWSFLKVSYVDLDQDDGPTGERNTSGAITLPKPGTKSGETMPANTSVLVRKVINRQRGARVGRIYIAGVPELDTTQPVLNVLESTKMAAWQTKMTAFLGDTNQNNQPFLGGTYNSWMVVSHITSRGAPKTKTTKYGPVSYPGEPLTGQALKVTGLAVDSRLATQRRRLRD